MSGNTPNTNAASPTSEKLSEVINNHVEIFDGDELAVLNSAVVELQAYEETLEGGLPVNVDVPHVQQLGPVLNCTMGNWEGEPDNYTYRWLIDADEVGADKPNHQVTTDDIGKTATCIVTASNRTGSTEAPPSNGVVIADPG